MQKKIAVLIPCYNESLTVEKVISDFRKELPEATIYVYDNNSARSSCTNTGRAKAMSFARCSAILTLIVI